MLHVLLTILKIIGILLLVILGIILFLILLVLFVPVRYRVHVRIDQDILEADGRVSWLFHLVRVDLDYAKKSGQAVIRLLGKKIKTIRFPQNQPESGPVPGAAEEPGKEKGSDAADSVQAGVNAQIEPGEAKDAAGTEDVSGGEQEKGSEAKDAAGTEDVSGGEQEKGSGARDAAGTEDVSGGEQEKGSGARDAVGGDQEEGAESGDQGLGQKITRIIEKLLSFIEKLLDLVMRLLYLPYDIYDQYESVTHRTGAKIDAIKKKVAPFLSIEGEHIIRKLIRYLKKLILHYGPRKISGYLRFGTSLPDLTGQLTGLVYVLLPKAGSGYSVEPDFYEMRLETDTTASGHIRMNHLAWIAIRLVTDKEFWTLLRKIRGKEKAGKNRGRGHNQNPGAGISDWDDTFSEEASGSGAAEQDKAVGNRAAENHSAENGYDRSGPENGHKGNTHHKKAGKKHKKKKTGNRKISKKR